MVEQKVSISGVFCKGAERAGQVLTALTENNHLLRRFGQVDYIHLEGQGEGLEIFRQEADEVWVVVEGHARFSLLDRRQDSPTLNVQNIIDLSADDPHALLVPFGVLCRVSTIMGGKFIRMTTHEDGTIASDLLP
jgi:dTDP-4-dehydrorhamnose 3,5-epimerase-like enzyme